MQLKEVSASLARELECPLGVRRRTLPSPTACTCRESVSFGARLHARLEGDLQLGAGQRDQRLTAVDPDHAGHQAAARVQREPDAAAVEDQEGDVSHGLFGRQIRPGAWTGSACTGRLSVRRRWYYLNVLKRTLEGARDCVGQIEAAAAASCGVAALACTLWLPPAARPLWALAVVLAAGTPAGMLAPLAAGLVPLPMEQRLLIAAAAVGGRGA